MERDTSPLRTWPPVLIWTVIVALESAFGSAANTGPLFQELSRWLVGYVDPERLAIFHHILRKAGHFLGYGIFGYLWFRAFARTCARISLLSCAALAITATFLMASLDEWNQSFSSARTGQFTDVILDASGALVLVALALIAVTRRRRYRLGV